MRPEAKTSLHLHVRREDRLAGGDLPDVHVVHGDDAARAEDVLADLRHVGIDRGGLAQHVRDIAEQDEARG